MASGNTPSVRSLDLRAINLALQQIAGRLGALETSIGATAAQAGQTTLTLSQSNNSISNLASRIAALEAGGASGATEVSLRADSAVALYDVVYPTSATGASRVEPTNLETVRSIIGVAENAAAANGTFKARRFGNMTVTGAAFTPGDVVYWGLDGFTHVPDYVPAAIPVGIATSASSLFVLVGEPAVITHGPYTDLELFLPVTYALVKAAVELVDTLIGQPDGIVVKVGSELQTRAIITSSASGVLITNGDGVAGDPHIELG